MALIGIRIGNSLIGRLMVPVVSLSFVLMNAPADRKFIGNREGGMNAADAAEIRSIFNHHAPGCLRDYYLFGVSIRSLMQ